MIHSIVPMSSRLFQRVGIFHMWRQSNGLAEKTVQTAKSMLEKAKRDRKIHISYCSNNEIRQ